MYAVTKATKCRIWNGQSSFSLFPSIYNDPEMLDLHYLVFLQSTLLPTYLIHTKSTKRLITVVFSIKRDKIIFFLYLSTFIQFIISLSISLNFEDNVYLLLLPSFPLSSTSLFYFYRSFPLSIFSLRLPHEPFVPAFLI